MVVAELGSEKPQPCLPFWSAAASAEQTPWPEPLLAQQAEPQSALLTHPPVMNCWPLPAPTFLAPALLGVTAARAVKATTEGRMRVSPWSDYYVYGSGGAVA
jgi:hypothetical protein